MSDDKTQPLDPDIGPCPIAECGGNAYKFTHREAGGGIKAWGLKCDKCGLEVLHRVPSHAIAVWGRALRSPRPSLEEPRPTIHWEEIPGGFVVKDSTGRTLMSASRGSRAVEGGPNNAEEWEHCAFAMASMLLKVDERAAPSLVSPPPDLEKVARYLHSIFFDRHNVFCGAESASWKSFGFKAELIEVARKAIAEGESDGRGPACTLCRGTGGDSEHNCPQCLGTGKEPA